MKPREALARARDHPWHLALALGAAGLALSPVAPSVPVEAVLVLLAAGGFASPHAGRVALVPCALLAGLLLGGARLEAIDATAALVAPGDDIRATAHLLSRPREGPFGLSAEVKLASGPGRGARLTARFPAGARLPADAGPGTEIRLSGHVRAPPAADRGRRDRPGRPFDPAAHARRRGLAGELSVREGRVTGRLRGGWRGVLDRARRTAEAALTTGLDGDQAALAAGMVLGQDERIAPGPRADFRDSGLGHVLAVSGQNVVLLTALALPLLAALGLGPTARLAATVGLVALYVPLAGAGPSLQRAGVMGAASLVALAAARPASRWYALLLAACATLAVNPRTTGEPGWQLSFAAVAGILALAPSLRGALAPLPRLLAEGLAITVAATLATAPLVAHHFGSLPLAGLAANVAALPLVAPIMWLGMLRAAFGGLEVGGHAPMGELLAHALAPLLAALAGVASTFAELPGAQVGMRLDSPVAVAGAYLALGLTVLWLRRAASRHPGAAPAAARVRRLPRARRAALAAAVGALLAVGFALLSAPPAPPDRVEVAFLDVGQGDATLVQHPDGSAVLFDGGPPEGQVARLLRRAGVRRLSALVMTHASRDHHGGLAEVVRRFPVDVVLDGGDGTRDGRFRAIVAGAQRRGAERIEARAPLRLRAGRLAIEVLSPPPRPPGPPPEDPNPRAVVAVVRGGGLSLFLSADAESPTLAPLALPDVDAMKVPHHGSDDPGLPDLLRRLRPEVAAVPVGPNGYGHPAATTLATLRSAGVATLRTDRHGTVELSAGADGLVARAERSGSARHAP